MFSMDFEGFVNTNDLTFSYFVIRDGEDYLAYMGSYKIKMYSNYSKEFSKMCQHV